MPHPAASTVEDARQLRCPMPLLRLKQALRRVPVGECVQLLATDPQSERDVQAFVALTPHQLIDRQHEGETFTFIVRRGV